MSDPHPQEWFVVFKRRSRGRITNMIPGRFKHVLAFAFMPAVRAWLFVEFAWQGGTAVAIVPNDIADRYLSRASHNAVVVKVRAGRAGMPRWGLWCVPAIAHVTGIRSCALRPDAFFRDCLRHGGEIVIGDDNGFAEDSVRGQD